MAKHRASGDDPSSREGVTGGPDTAYWSVDDSRWPAVRPDLPAHMVDLLAPPIVVGVARVPVTSRLTPPAERRPGTPAEPRPTPPAEPRPTTPAGSVPPTGQQPTPPTGSRPVPAEHRAGAPTGLRRILSAGPGAPGRRPGGAPAPAGRHRRGSGQPDRTS
ncbi:hypothetical protein [Micromonospora sp. NPDC047074]|uniref:hypothetical protein n=1 Tax=Micromonospora sp. NPDC047074 TaxID=3154339 RepID=UPI0033D806D4